MAIKRTIKRNADSENISINECFDLYLERKQGMYVVDKTIKNYYSSLKKFLSAIGLTGEEPIEKIDEGEVYHFINSCRNAELAPASINHYLRDIRAFLYYCMEAEYIKTPYKIKNIPNQEEKIKLFTEEDMNKLLEKPKNKDSYATWRSWAVCNWIYDNGNRCATVCNVKISDISFAKHEITLTHTKAKKLQVIPMSGALENVLKEYIRIWRGGVIDGYLFCNVGELQLTSDALKHSFAKYCKDREVEQTSLHALRHTFAKQWIKNNGNPMTLQRVLGHSTLDMTKRYIRLFSEDIKNDYEDFSPLGNAKKLTKRTNKMIRS